MFVQSLHSQATESSAGGRPTKIIDPTILEEAFLPGRNISIACLARTLGVSRPTLYKRMKEQGIERTFTDISDTELSTFLNDFKTNHPTSGFRYALGHLRHSGLHIQRERVLDCLRSLDGLAVQQRTNQPIARRVYTSPRPNYLWHQDGHHKLGPWGVVIHGIIDGYDRMVCRILL